MKRSRTQLYKEILELLSSGPKGKTQIVYGCNLGFRPAAGYLRELIGKGLIEGAPERQCRITAKGLAALSTMSKALSLMLLFLVVAAQAVELSITGHSSGSGLHLLNFSGEWLNVSINATDWNITAGGSI